MHDWHKIPDALAITHIMLIIPQQDSLCYLCWGRGTGGVKSAGVSQSVRETGRDESQSVPYPEKKKKLFKTRDLELPIFEGSVPSCSPHSAGYTRTSVHPYFPMANFCYYLVSPYPLNLGGDNFTP